MNVIIGLQETEEILSWDVSDEALEIAGAAGQEIAGAYTLQFCTSMDCALATQSAAMVLILDRQPTFAAANICLWPKRTFSTVSDHPARSCVFEHYVVQCVSIWARFDSTSELNARSHPSSARSGVGFPVEMESRWPG